ncbi:hypothetical protein [Lacticaseibacillus daqingensis]|uniref:hypothetical protein n=1 Tax=Lacticaseibacillus daqingensis TaxID=2486014 RepID=UPI000F76806E|nr:hypothetical protein [Lacticaseibacillus daqingensis]
MSVDSVEHRQLGNQIGGKSASIAEVFEMLRKYKELFPQMTANDQKIFEEMLKLFPISDENLNIAGSKAVLDVFNELNTVKEDYVIPAKDFEISDFPRSSGDSRIEMAFKCWEPDHKGIFAEGTTIYDARKQYLDKSYKMNTFAEAQIEEGNTLLILETLEKLRGITPDRAFKFRFLRKGKQEDGKLLLRSVVGDQSYKNYDNCEVLFLALMGAYQYAKEQHVNFYVSSLDVTDSKMDLLLLSQDTTELEGGVHAQVGLAIRNSEIADGSANFELLYKLDYRESTVTLSDSSVFTINHGWRLETIAERLKNLSRLHEASNQVFLAVNAAKLYEPASDASLAKIFNPLLRSKSILTEKTREEVVKLRTEAETADQVETLLILFSKLEDLAAATNNQEVIWTIREALSKYIRNR